MNPQFEDLTVQVTLVYGLLALSRRAVVSRPSANYLDRICVNV